MLMEFNEIKKIIDDYIKNKAVIEVEKKEDGISESFDGLNEVFNYSLNRNGYINHFKEIILNDSIICLYDITSLDKSNTTRYIAYVENGMPICLISSTEYKDDKITHQDNNYSIYIEGTRHVQTRMNIENTVVDNIEILDANILDVHNGHYVRKKYELYKDDSGIIALTTDKDKYFSNTVSFNTRLETVLKDMEMISTKINDRLTDCFSDAKENVKEYSIKRKESQ